MASPTRPTACSSWARSGRWSAPQRERYSLDLGWMPPCVSTFAAIDQAVMIADRYQRSFLRLMKTYSDILRLFGTLMMADRQVNIGEQQVNVAGSDGSPIEP